MRTQNYFVTAVTLAASLSLISSADAAPITTLFHTGSTVAEGVTDPNWTLGTNIGGYGPTLTTATTGSFPLSGSWLANNATSKWIVPNNTQTTHVAGNYDFLTSFSLTGFNPNTASITFRFAVDNTLTDVFLNGASLGVTGGSLTTFSSFVTRDNTTNPGGFLPGTNTLRFVVNNATGTTQNPTGLRVEISGSASIVPEGNTALLVVFSVPFLVGTIIRRRK